MSDITYTSPTERVNTWLDGSTLFIEFNNPARHNALSVDMWEAVPVLLDLAEQDSRVRLVVFKGAGEKAFVSGADISQFEDMRAAKEAVTRYEAMAEAALMGIYNFSKPTLACIQGYCIGGGVNVAISCDMRIAASDEREACRFCAGLSGGSRSIARSCAASSSKPVAWPWASRVMTPPGGLGVASVIWATCRPREFSSTEWP